MPKIILSRDWNKHKEGTVVTVDDLRAAWLRKPALKPRKERSRSEFSFGPSQTPTPRLSERDRVERFFNRIKHFRRVATRYEKHASNYLAIIKLACVKI